MHYNFMRILGIETSCDETSLAVVEASGGLRASKFRVIKNLVASQIKIHRPFGGVVPNLAKREHLKNLPLLWKRIMNNELRIRGGKKSLNSKFSILSSIDLIAVTVGPGLEPALWTGIIFAKELWQKMKHETRSVKPIVGANHLEGHLYSFLLENSFEFRASSFNNMFPAVTLLVSGGHTILLKMDSLTKWKKLGETRDDAAGEAFDKVARMLNLPYPGGPEIERLAKSSKLKAQSYIPFPRPMMHDKSY
ncbi:MAG: O-sialoglycoprotein endopeptidase, partial [Parcubacteria group bacterium Gr01-1014_70]